jgi:tetratricopeptide (TPR) repeat protein
MQLKAHDARAHYNLGTALHGQRKFPEAEAEFRKAIELNANSAAAHAGLAQALLDQSKFPEAEAEYHEAIRLDPKNFWSRYNLGLALRVQGRLPEAEAVQRELVALLPNDPNRGHAHHALGRTFLMQGKYAQAEAEFQEAIRLKPQEAIIYHSLADFWANCPDIKFRDPERALEHAQKAVELAPEVAKHWLWPIGRSPWNTLGVVRYRVRHWNPAIEALEKSMQLNKGGDAFDWFFLAMAHWQLGHKEEARKWYDQAIEWVDTNQPKNDDLRRFRAEAAELLKIEDKPNPK